MGIRIIRIKINSAEFTNWLNNEGFVCLEDEEYYPTTQVQLFFDEALQDHYHDESQHNFHTLYDHN